MKNKPITALAALTLTVLLAACVPTTDTSSPPPPVSEGDYPYVCTLHSGMRGTVTVIDPA